MTGCGTRLLVTGATGSLGGAVAARLAGDGHRVRGLVRFGPAPLVRRSSPIRPTDRRSSRPRRGWTSRSTARPPAATSTSVSGSTSRARRTSWRRWPSRDADCSSTSPPSPSTTAAAAGRRSTRTTPCGPRRATPTASPRPRPSASFLRRRAEISPWSSSARPPSCRWIRVRAGTGRHRASPRRRRAFLTSPELAYVHVDDVVDAIVLAAESRAARGEPTMSSGGLGDTREYLDAIHRAAGRPAPPMSRQGPSFRYPTDRIRRELGWAPRDRWRGFLDELARHGAP